MRRVLPWCSLALLLAFCAAVRVPGAEPAPQEAFSREQRAHWAYQVPQRPAQPAVKERLWVRNPVDAFIAAGLDEMGLPHAGEADRVALLRRVTFDLTGLPPTLEQLEQYLHDRSTDAYERVVDRLLESPAYGERWAQHWLDLAHYADSNGFELDAERPDAWRYRDWVVAALNADMPYDRFLTLQLAGDEAAPGDTSALIATGFGRCGPREVVGGNADTAVKRQSELTEITGTVGSVFLGLTVACARCHDHKFDALPTTDYYRLQSFFAAAQLVEKPIATADEQRAYAAARKGIDAQTTPLRQAMARLEAPYRTALSARKQAMLTPAERAIMAIPPKQRTPEQKRLAEGFASTLTVRWEEVAEAVAANPADYTERERLKQAIDKLQRAAPRPPAHAMALVDEGTSAPDAFVYRRGDPRNRGPLVAPHPPGVVLASLPREAFPADIPATSTTTGRRLALARWLTRADNPLTARVIVNRLWQHHFGRGIVATPSDFGVRGEAPSHPELLDWLATELVAQGWRLKPLHRLMVTSATYRQSQRADPKLLADDPENSLFGRMNRRRMEAESLRDALLVVTGELNPRAGGPGVLVPIEKEVEDLIFTEAEVVDLWPETPNPAEHLRRSLYLFRKRNVRYPLFEAFDAPDTQTACPQRGVSTHALQALVLTNSDFVVACAKALAGRILRDCEHQPEDRLSRMYRVVLAREPNPAEVAQAGAFLSTQADLLRRHRADGRALANPAFVPATVDAGEAAAWVDFALAMINRNEFVYVP